MLPEERARKGIDKQLMAAGWDIVSRDEYVPKTASAVFERQYNKRLATYKKIGFRVFSVCFTENEWQHYAIIDQTLVWYGGMNLLGKADA